MLERSSVKLVAFDLDGTILNNQGKISLKTKRTINKILGEKIIVSARTLDSIEEVISGLDVSGIIYSNGAGIISGDKNIYSNFISYNDYQLLLEIIFKNYPDLSIKVKGNINRFITKDDINEVIDKIEKITIKINENDKLIALIKKLKIFNLDVVNNEYIILTNRGVSKYLSLKKYLNIKHIKLEDVMYFGNDLNDLEIFKKLPLVVAVKNSDSKVRDVATYICGSNNEDGVAKFLIKYFNSSVENKISNFNGGSVAEVIYDKSSHCIQKNVSINNEGINNGYSKLFYEVKHMQQYNLKNQRKLYPKIYEITEKNQQLVVKMEYLYQGLTLTDLIFKEHIGCKFINKSINNIIDSLFNELYLNKKNIIPNSNYLEINYFDRIATRIDKVNKMLRKSNKYLKIKSAIRDGIYLNGKYYPSILEYNNFLRNDKLAKKVLMPCGCTESHHDLIPSNIMVNYNLKQPEICDFKLIDPRGDGDTGIDTRHFTYDLGKLLFGFNGFELFRRVSFRKNYTLTFYEKDNIFHYQFKIVDGPLTNKLENARKCVLKQLEENKYKYFDSINLIETYREKILLAEAYCFFADIPCRLINGDDEEVLLCFYLKGMECLTEFMKLLYGRDLVCDD